MRGLGQSTLEKVLSPTAAVGFFRSLWEKPIWKGVWPYRTRVRSWKHQWLLLCRWKIMGDCGSGGSNKIKKQNFAVFWKLMNPQECVWEIRYRIIIKTILQEKVKFIRALQFGLQIYSCASSYENSCSESSGGQGMGKLEKILAWNLTKVRSKKEVIDEARMSGATVHFCIAMDICHLKNAELETKHQKYEGRVVLRGDIVNNDSGFFQFSLNKVHQHLK